MICGRIDNWIVGATRKSAKATTTRWSPCNSMISYCKHSINPLTDRKTNVYPSAYLKKEN